MKILVTGCAGFIGMHLSRSLLKDGYKVFGFDNLNSYYDISLKSSRLKILNQYDRFNFKNIDLIDKDNLHRYFNEVKPRIVINLAAQAGVRYSIQNPQSYISSNIAGFQNLLDCCKDNEVELFVYASSSSVYGRNKKNPFSEKDSTDSPVSLYAVTKKTNELMANAYYNLHGLKSVGLRFFTVYGPWGRPDMAYYIFAKNIMDGKPIKVFNHGKMDRDYTYIDDTILGVKSVLNKNFELELFNIGNNQTRSLHDLISIIENKLGKKAIIELLPFQNGDVQKTYADIDKAAKMLNYSPKTSLEVGLEKFLNWFIKYYPLTKLGEE